MFTAVLPQTADPIPAVLPQLLIPSPQYYRQLCPHYRGITAVFPSSPLPCSSLIRASDSTIVDHCARDKFLLLYCIIDQPRSLKVLAVNRADSDCMLRNDPNASASQYTTSIVNRCCFGFPVSGGI